MAASELSRTYPDNLGFSTRFFRSASQALNGSTTSNSAVATLVSWDKDVRVLPTRSGSEWRQNNRNENQRSIIDSNRRI